MKTNSKRGFTLIETLVIVTVIAILALIAVPAYQGYTQRPEQRNYNTMPGSSRTRPRGTISPATNGLWVMKSPKT